MSERDKYSVPRKMKAKYDAIIEWADAVCLNHLNEDYAELSRKMAAALSRLRPSPFATGRAKSWAAGMVYALGKVNFLFDPSQTPHLSGTELCKLFGVSQSTASSKARDIFRYLNIMPLHPEWCLPSLIDENPLAWKVMVNGMIVDVRMMPREIQQEAYELGLIPYMPEE